jgi:hypothetical protein
VREGTWRLQAMPALPGGAVALMAIAAYLQLMFHDPRHLLLTGLALWGALSMPVGLLAGHAALSENE